MGYTHYWSHDRNLDRKKLFLAIQDAVKIVEAAKAKGIALGSGAFGTEGDVEFGEPTISLNGVGEESHEEFIFPSFDEWQSAGPFYPPKGYLWAFCKTARKPYDLVVCAILLVLKHHLGKQIRLASDGGRREDEWLPAERLVHEVLGYEVIYREERTLVEAAT